MDNMQPIITKKKIYIILAILVAFLLLLGVGLSALIDKGPGQEVVDESDQLLDYAASGSKIADIQALVTDGGLTNEQYTLAYRELTTKLPKLEPDSSYFAFVEGSLNFTTTATDTAWDAIEVPLAPERGGDEGPDVGADSPASSVSGVDASEEVNNVIDTLEFIMRSESGAEYKVSIYTGGDLTAAKITIEKQ